MTIFFQILSLFPKNPQISPTYTKFINFHTFFSQPAPISNNGAVSAKPRRSSLKMTLKRAYSSASASSNVLTEERRQIVQVTWKEITDLKTKLRSSLEIFRILFVSCPELKKVFNVSDIDSDNLESSESFVRHARVFANVLDLAVRNVFELETEVGPILIMFGRRHFYKHKVEFRNEYLALFGQSISEVVHGNLSESFVLNSELGIGWRLFVSYIINKIKEGYDLETLHARK